MYNFIRKMLVALALLVAPVSCTLAMAQSSSQTNPIYPAQVFTASSQTGSTIHFGNVGGSGGSYSVATVSVTGTALTTVTFSVYGSTDGGVTFYALNVNPITSPSTLATSTTVTTPGLYQVNIATITDIQIRTSGTFTATAVAFTVTVSPNGSIARSTSGGGGPPSGNAGGVLAGSYPNPTAGSTGAWNGSVTANTLIPALNSFDVVSGSINTLVGSTDYQDDGLGGYITCHSATVNCVGLFGAGYLYNQGGHAWGGNSFVADQVGCTSCIETGWESDINTENASDVAAAYAAEAVMYNAQPATAVGFEVDIPRPVTGHFAGAQWTAGFQAIDACCQNGFVTGASSTAPSSPSMTNFFFSIDSGGVRRGSNQYTDLAGNFVFQPYTGVSKFVNFVNAITGFQVNGTALAAANLSDGNSGTGAIIHKISPTINSPTFGGNANYNPTCTATSGANCNSYVMFSESEIWNGSAATPCNLGWANIAASASTTNSSSYMTLTESGCPGAHWGALIGSSIGLIGDNGAIYGNITATPSLTGTYASTLVIPTSNTYYRLTLTGNVNSSSIAAGTYDGQDLCIDIVQNATTAFTFSFPTNMHIGSYAIGTVLGKDNVICSKYNATATIWIGLNTGVINE